MTTCADAMAHARPMTCACPMALIALPVLLDFLADGGLRPQTQQSPRVLRDVAEVALRAEPAANARANEETRAARPDAVVRRAHREEAACLGGRAVERERVERSERPLKDSDQVQLTTHTM